MTQGEPPITVRTWAKVLVFGGVTAAGLIVLLGVILPFVVLDPPHGLGIHPLLAHNPGSSPGKDDTYGRIVAGLVAWLGGTYVGIRSAGIHGRRERSLAALSLAAVVAILFVANVLTDPAQAREGEPLPPRDLPALVGGRTPLPSCGDDKLDPHGDPISVGNHRCLLDAFVAGETAELVIYDTPNGEPTEQIIRVMADATIEVFVHTGADDTVGWERYSCTALRPASAPQLRTRRLRPARRHQVIQPNSRLIRRSSISHAVRYVRPTSTCNLAKALICDLPLWLRRLADVHDAEPIALGIGEDDVVGVGRPLVPVDLGRAQGDEALDLGGLILGVQVEVDPGWLLQGRADPVERDVRSHAIPRAEQDEAVVARFLARHVVERCRPERRLALDIVDAQDDRADTDHAGHC